MSPKRQPRSRTAEPSPRQLRVGEEVRHGLARIFERQEMNDPALVDVTLTVTEVRMSPDLKHATVFVMPLAGAHAPEVLAGLKRGAAYLRGLIAREVPLRFTPTLSFTLDMSFEQANRINEILHRPEVRRDVAEAEHRTRDDSSQDDGTEDDGGA
ncbi:MAG TPA: 30S ribosome-binding factor RbfA [Stellaceae bacterium]|nr:30S ribosome-binding factor RbfA [Stellaceae bacterium]